jgi:hypothetical protein
VPTVGQELTVTDSTAVQPVGWREITAVGDGVELSNSSVPSHSPSQVLRTYPEELLDDPLDQRDATLQVVAGSGVVTGRDAPHGPGRPVGSRHEHARQQPGGAGRDAAARGRLRPRRRRAGGPARVVARLRAGHGKTLMAAYLLGRDGTLRQAALIGASVTVTHTAGSSCSECSCRSPR